MIRCVVTALAKLTARKSVNLQNFTAELKIDNNVYTHHYSRGASVIIICFTKKQLLNNLLS